MKKAKARLGRVAALTAAALVLAVSAAGPAAADARLCRQLRAELAAGGGGSARQIGKYERAIDSQADELSRARAMARQGGCSGLFSRLASRADARCGVIVDTIRRMERNLAQLQRTRDNLAGRRSGGDRRRLLDALDANGCNAPETTVVRRLPPPVAPAASEARRPALFERLNGGVVIRRSGPPEESEEAPARIGVPERPGSYRTLCVRTCDGFYFPISFATSPQNFSRDENICRARCPDAKVELYYHHVPDEDSEAMVSLSGVPYIELPAAFLYRRAGAKLPAGCGCGTSATASSTTVPSGAPNYSVIAGKPPSAEAEDEPALPVSGSFVAPPAGSAPMPEVAPEAAPEQVPPASAAEPSADRKVRVVGPTFLPDPSEAIDLRGPVQSEVR